MRSSITLAALVLAPSTAWSADSGSFSLSEAQVKVSGSTKDGTADSYLSATVSYETSNVASPSEARQKLGWSRYYELSLGTKLPASKSSSTFTSNSEEFVDNAKLTGSFARWWARDDRGPQDDLFTMLRLGGEVGVARFEYEPLGGGEQSTAEVPFAGQLDGQHISVSGGEGSTWALGVMARYARSWTSASSAVVFDPAAVGTDAITLDSRIVDEPTAADKASVRFHYYRGFGPGSAYAWGLAFAGSSAGDLTANSPSLTDALGARAELWSYHHPLSETVNTRLGLALFVDVAAEDGELETTPGLLLQGRFGSQAYLY